ncbi:DUF948 domain-containing protein [Helcococcus ovis]|uniref:DUF948 domain-containing protein n=2 Tax=Helcococcus ovis TaxID=72026 RepID=A0A4R9C174_9FIRM|nr:DUF948 domain-containing protein [Helcococcus ovis]TFF65461.1 hypothetical protein EQF92_02660 [Helcococcus ovis]TFF66097.1 hypothetical protein EQF91_04670 [Helcococcus ovis]TFF67861.1 hypothetical protein EQF93_04530 [Helcococcus ovis]WNZ02040.1 DUF948 domain-containing protein [Helcococcus ovis]
MLANNAINISFTLYDVLIFVLIITAIVCLIFLAKVFISLANLLGNINKTLEDNKESLDGTLKNLPDVITNINSILVNTDEIVNDIKPSITSTLADVSKVTNNVSNITTNLSDTVEVVGIAAADTASRFTNTFTNATDYVSLFKGIIKLISKIKK